MLLTIDPGIRGAGAAIYRLDSGELVSAAYCKSPLKTGNQAAECRAVAMAVCQWVDEAGYSDEHITQIAVEWPRMLPPGQQRGDQNDLPALAAVSTAVTIAFPAVEVKSLYPRDWKGTVAPDVMTMRISNRLSEHEATRVQWHGKARDPRCGVMHNVFDAIGIGLWVLGRLDRARAYTYED